MEKPHSSISRRRFLGLSALTSLAPVALPQSQAVAPTQPGRAACFVASLNAYSFLEPLNENLKDSTKGVDLFGVIDFCVKHDIPAIDLTGYFFPDYPAAPPDSYIRRIKRYVHSNGMVITGTGVKNDFASADKSVRSAGIELTKTWIEVAARLGAPVIRVFAGPHGGKDWRVAADNAPRRDVEIWMADALRQCAEHGEKFGVIVAVQNHGDFIGSGPEHISLLNAVGHEWCGALVDTGKYLTEDPYADIAMMVPYAVNWQIKETMGSSMKSPKADFGRLVKIIHEGGFRGFVPIETLSMGRAGYDPAAEVVKVLRSMREAIASLSR